MGSRALPLLKTARLEKSQSRKLPSQEKLPRKPERWLTKLPRRLGNQERKRNPNQVFVSSVVLRLPLMTCFAPTVAQSDS